MLEGRWNAAKGVVVGYRLRVCRPGRRNISALGRCWKLYIGRFDPNILCQTWGLGNLPEWHIQEEADCTYCIVEGKYTWKTKAMDRLFTSRMRFSFLTTSLQWMEGEQELSAIAPKSLILLAFLVKISGVPVTKGRLIGTTTFGNSIQLLPQGIG